MCVEACGIQPDLWLASICAGGFALAIVAGFIGWGLWKNRGSQD